MAGLLRTIVYSRVLTDAQERDGRHSWIPKSGLPKNTWKLTDGH